MSNLDPNKVKVYEILFAMGMKFILTAAGLTGFFIILHYLINAKTDNERYVFGALELLLVGTTYKIYSHYFPSPKSPASKK